MKLNNHLGYDQETTLEYFQAHIFPKEILIDYLYELNGIWALYDCNTFRDDRICTHVDTYLSEDRTHWRVQIREIFLSNGFSNHANWAEAVRAANEIGFGKPYSNKKTGELAYVDITDKGIEITYTFSMPFIEEMPTFATRKELREWVRSLMKWK